MITSTDIAKLRDASTEDKQRRIREIANERTQLDIFTDALEQRRIEDAQRIYLNYLVVRPAVPLDVVKSLFTEQQRIMWRIGEHAP